LSGPIPSLEANGAGNVVRAINVTINGGQNAVGSAVDPDNDGSFSVDDIVNDDPGEVLFASSTIKGSGSTWDFRDTFDRVEILNSSSKSFTINNVDVVNRTAPPFVDLQSSGNPALTFAIARSVRPTLVDVDNATAS